MSHRDKLLRNQQGISQKATVSAQASYFAGPLPPPEVLEKYNAAFLGAAERIVGMAERQSQHRQNLETRVIEAGLKVQSRGQIMGFIIALAVVLGGFILIWNDKNWQGLVAIIGSLVSLVATFVIGRTRQKKELEAKASEFGPRPVVDH